MFVLPMSSLPTALLSLPWLLPVHPLRPPSSGLDCVLRWQLLPVMLQGGEARAGVCLQVAVEGGLKAGSGFQLPSAGLADMWMQQSVHTYGFGMFIWSFHFMIMPP